MKRWWFHRYQNRKGAKNVKKTKEEKILLAVDILRKMSSRKVDTVNCFSLCLMVNESYFEETSRYIHAE